MDLGTIDKEELEAIDLSIKSIGGKDEFKKAYIYMRPIKKHSNRGIGGGGGGL